MTRFVGVGGGFLIVPALVLVLGFPMRLALGTSLVVIAVNSAAGILAHLQAGGFDLPLALLLVAGGFAGATAGGRLAGCPRGLLPDRARRRGPGVSLWLWHGTGNRSER